MNTEFKRILRDYEENIEKEAGEIIKWIQEQFKASGAEGAIVGLSGGIDSSVVARLLQEAGVPIVLVMLPYGESMNLAEDGLDAEELILKFGFSSMLVDITKSVDSIIKGVQEEEIIINNTTGQYQELVDNGVKLTKMAMDNVKPRVRMMTLYTLAQSMNYLVVGTGNLSELTMGYFTKWGDGAADINPVASLTKSQVRILAKYLELPERIITKPPSANLWEGQTDEDEMGITYEELDQYILTKEGTEEVKELVDSRNKQIQHKFSVNTL